MTTNSIHVVVPVYNAESHILSFLQNLELALSELDVSFRVTLVNDGSTDQSLSIVTTHIKDSKFDSWNLIDLRERVGQQMAIWNGLSTTTKDETLVVADDDMILSSYALGELLNPIFSKSNDLVVAQQSAKGVRRLSSGVYWFAHQKFSKRKYEGRDLMLRAVAPEIVAKIIDSKSGLLSVSETTEAVSKKPVRIRGIDLSFLRTDSRYSSFDRFKLFVDLILVRKDAIGYLIMLCGLTMICLTLFTTLLAAMLGLISLNSPGTLLALFILLLGSINLVVVGIVQVSIVTLLKETSN